MSDKTRFDPCNELFFLQINFFHHLGGLNTPTEQFAELFGRIMLFRRKYSYNKLIFKKNFDLPKKRADCKIFRHSPGRFLKGFF